MAPLRNAVRFVDHQQRDPEGLQQLEKPLVLHPLRRQIEQPKPPLVEILSHSVLFNSSEAGVKCSSSNLPLPQSRELILHQRNERRNHQRQPRHESRRQLIAERLPLSGRHDRHCITPGQHRANDFFLARPKRRKAELFAERSSQIIHGKAHQKMGWEQRSPPAA